MQDRPARATWVGVGLVTGIPFAGWLFVQGFVTGDEPLVRSLLAALTGGAVLGVPVGFLASRDEVSLRRPLGGRSDDEVDQAVEAIEKGPMPTDQGRRTETIAVGQVVLQESERSRTFSVTTFGTMTVLCTYLVVDGSPWWSVPGVAFVGLALHQWWWPRRFADRLRAAEA